MLADIYQLGEVQTCILLTSHLFDGMARACKSFSELYQYMRFSRVSFCRKTLGYDVGLPTVEGFGNKILVHSTPAGDSKPFTSFEMSIGPGQLWREARLGSSLTIRVYNYEGNNAVIGVCRPDGRTETACGDKKDNDCDTLIDAQDPDCRKPASPVPPARGLLAWFKE